MAEYIDRAKVDYEFITTRGGGDTITNLYERILDIPSADVVERSEYSKLIVDGFLKDCESCKMHLHSKIDEAIKEVIKYRDDEKNDFCEVEVGAINGALEIIKKTMGVDYDS